MELAPLGVGPHQLWNRRFSSSLESCPTHARVREFHRCNISPIAALSTNIKISQLAKIKKLTHGIASVYLTRVEDATEQVFAFSFMLPFGKLVL
jgi:hypothetical protein